MKKILSVLMISSILIVQTTSATPLTEGGGGSIQSILNAQKGNVVTLKLQSGNELTGTVGVVSVNVVHLSKLAGKELFDAAADISNIEAILVRSKK